MKCTIIMTQFEQKHPGTLIRKLRMIFANSISLYWIIQYTKELEKTINLAVSVKNLTVCQTLAQQYQSNFCIKDSKKEKSLQCFAKLRSGISQLPDGTMSANQALSDISESGLFNRISENICNSFCLFEKLMPKHCRCYDGYTCHREIRLWDIIIFM